MPAADDAKTKSAPKSGQGRAWTRLTSQGRYKRKLYYVLGSLIALFALLSPTLFYQPAEVVLSAGGKTVHLEIAATQAAQEKGLSGRTNMPNNQGMLFVFAKPAVTCFWMKGMRFSLDLIWLNSHKQVVYIQQDITPQTYPKSFCPNSAAQYVLELNTGQVQRLSISINQTLHL